MIMITKRTCGLPLICLVCGDTARGINFNVMSCMSCKTFFRRHATKLHINLKCLRSNNCEISIQTRGDCSACRLDKCLTLGMNPKLIGKRFDHREKHHSNYYSKAKRQSKQVRLEIIIGNNSFFSCLILVRYIKSIRTRPIDFIQGRMASSFKSCSYIR